MRANVIPLRRQPGRVVVAGRLGAIETAVANDAVNERIDVAQVRSILEDLRARQDTLLSVIESLRTPLLKAHPKFGSIADGLEATSAQALVEVGLLIRHSTALLDMGQGG